MTKVKFDKFKETTEQVLRERSSRIGPLCRAIRGDSNKPRDGGPVLRGSENPGPPREPGRKLHRRAGHGALRARRNGGQKLSKEVTMGRHKKSPDTS